MNIILSQLLFSVSLINLQFAVFLYFFSDNNTTPRDSVNAVKNVNKRKLSPVSEIFFSFIYVFAWLNENVLKRFDISTCIWLALWMLFSFFFFKNLLSFQMKKIGNAIKILVLVGIWVLFTAVLMAKDEKELAYQPISVPVGEHKSKIHSILWKKRNRILFWIRITNLN